MSDSTEAGAPSDDPLVYVCDASGEAPRLVDGLRARGFRAMQVALAQLAARVAAQRPALIVCDLDAEGALDRCHELRDVPGGASVDIVFLGAAGRTLEDLADRVFHEGSGYFLRPVDVYALVRKVEALIGAPSSRRGLSPSMPSSAPPARALRIQPPAAGDAPSGVVGPVSSAPPSLVSPASLPPLSLSPATPATPETPPSVALPPASAGAPPSAIPPAQISLVPASSEAASSSRPSRPGAMGLDAEPAIGRDLPQAGLSAEVEQMLAAAERRLAGGLGAPAAERPTPEEELDAVMPADVLAALDEPLEEEEEDEQDSEDIVVSHGTSAGSSATSSATGAQLARAAREPPRGSVPAEGTAAGDAPESPPRADVPTTPPRATPAPPPVVSEPPPTPPRRRTVPPESAPPASFASGTSVLEGAPPTAGERATTAPPPMDPSAQPGWEPQLPSQAGAPPRSIDAGPSTTRDVPMAQAEGRGAFAVEEPPTPMGGIGAARASARTAYPQRFSATADEARAQAPSEPEVPGVLRPGDAVRALARAIRGRYSGALAYESDEGIRRVVLRDGDLVTAASGVEGESLVAFLAERGSLPADVAAKLVRRIPPYGRHGGAALIAQGHLRQDELWPALRGHAEWIVSRALGIERGAASLEREVPGRLAAEPAVFGGATGAEVLVEIVRRSVSSADAIARLGGPGARLATGPVPALLGECALSGEEAAWIDRAAGTTLGDLLGAAGGGELAVVIHALCELGVLQVLAAQPGGREEARGASRAPDALDDTALRARVATRKALVDEGDYFALLGVPRGATGYEIRRAYLDLRRELDPSRVLTARTADLGDDLDTILEVLEEAYEILRDDVRRERYRRAIDAAPA